MSNIPPFDYLQKSTDPSGVTGDHSISDASSKARANAKHKISAGKKRILRVREWQEKGYTCNVNTCRVLNHTAHDKQ